MPSNLYSEDGCISDILLSLSVVYHLHSICFGRVGFSNASSPHFSIHGIFKKVWNENVPLLHGTMLLPTEGILQYIIRAKIYIKSSWTMTQLFHASDYSSNLAEKFFSKNTEIAQNDCYTHQCWSLSMTDRYKDLYDQSLNGMYEPAPLLPVLRRSWRRILNAAFPKGRCWSRSAA